MSGAIPHNSAGALALQGFTGLMHGLSNEMYHGSGYGISNSGLLQIMKSPAHYFGLSLDPLRPPPEEQAGQLLGTLAHCALLEPAEFFTRYKIGPEARRNTKAWEAFEASMKPGEKAIKRSEHEAAKAIARSMRSIPDVRELLSRGRPEVSAYWIEDVLDANTGELIKVVCRCRPDWVHDLNDGTVILLDAKTCGDASPAEFARQIARKNYHHQAAFYIDGFEKASGKKVREFVFVQGEVNWPYVAGSCALYPEDIEMGRTLYRRNLETYARCLAANDWPGYSNKVELVSLPSYAKGAK